MTSAHPLLGIATNGYRIVVIVPSALRGIDSPVYQERCAPVRRRFRADRLPVPAPVRICAVPVADTAPPRSPAALRTSDARRAVAAARERVPVRSRLVEKKDREP